jgi:hypothetical protein
MTSASSLTPTWSGLPASTAHTYEKAQTIVTRLPPMRERKENEGRVASNLNESTVRRWGSQMSDRHPQYKLLKSLWHPARDATAIANEVGMTAKEALPYLDELIARSYVVGDGNRMGFYTITNAGRYAVLGTSVIPFELFAECVGQPYAASETVSIDVGGRAQFANKAVLECGCIAYQPQPPGSTPRMAVKPCSEEHARTLRAMWGFEVG